MHNLYRPICTCFFLWIATFFALAENYAPRDYSLVPPTPNVAQFLELKNFDVNNRGVPNISYTLYEIKAGAITVPIVLTYQGGGIKVNQQCGNAGMGWIVSCGAEIGHTLHGAPDDVKRTTLNGNQLLGLWHLEAKDKEFRNHLISKDTIFPSIDYDNFLGQNPGLLDGAIRYQKGLSDFANDIYTIYGLGLSGVFAYDENRRIL